MLVSDVVSERARGVRSEVREGGREGGRERERERGRKEKGQ